MKCYYEILNISREADSTEIKNAYRKLALKWHPDKNPNNPDEAKEQFQAVQNAYEVLSDLQERAWYDSHREQLLRGAGSTFNDESLDLILFFTPSCYKGFGDDEKGFYAVYKEVFKKLAAEEVDYLDDPEDISNIPMFGTSDAEYEIVHEFYSYWMSFSTAKSFVWLDKYNIREADNRRVLKMLEKENNKIRQKARKERNDEIRQLVAFVRRRDKRVIAHSKLLQEKAEENKKKAEQMRKEKLVKRQQELEEAKKRHSGVSVYSMNDFHEQLDQLEKHLTEEFGHSDEETLTGPSDVEETESLDGQNKVDPDMSSINGQSGKDKYYTASQSLYCTACNKLFKNVKSFENHENSKKHKENVSNMILETEIDFSDEDNSTSSSKLVENAIVDDELQGDLSSTDDEALLKAAALSKKKKKKNKKALSTFESNDLHLEDNANLDDLNDITRNRRARKAKNVEKLVTKTKENKLLTIIPDVIPSESTVSDIVLEDVNINDVNLSNDAHLVIEDETTKDDPTPDNSLKPEKKPIVGRGKEKKFSAKQKIQIANEIDVTSIDTSHCCAICKGEFASKNKLFDHLKKTGHQIFLSNSQAATKVKEKKKGSKNR